MNFNLISENKYFKRTALYASFLKRPLGFVDIGGAGGIHPNISVFASLTDCLCFEPGRKAYQELRRSFGKFNPFSSVTLLNIAITGKAGSRRLYVTKNPVNSSLIEPGEELVRRYGVEGFRKERKVAVPTDTLDRIILKNNEMKGRAGEFIKMDCQGAEYEILRGARKTLENNCVAVLLEAEFFRIYKGQKLFSDVDFYLRKKGFQLYGLYPHYISAKKIDRRRYGTEERIIWADLLYFKDPMAFSIKKRNDLSRKIEALIMTAVINHFYDFAMELAERYLVRKTDLENIKKLILDLAKGEKETLDTDFESLIKARRKMPNKKYLLVKKFIDEHKSNNSVDFIKV